MSNFTIRAAQLFLIVLCVSFIYVVMTRKLKLAWAIELALMLMVFAIVGGLDALLSDRPFLDTESVAARWLLAGSSAALVAGFVLWRLFGPHHSDEPRRRLTDFAEFTGPAPIGTAERRKRVRRPWFRWHGPRR